MALTLARLAITESGLGTAEDAKRAQETAKRAHAEFAKFLPMIEHRLNPKDRTEIEKMRVELEQMLSLSPFQDGL